MSTIAPETSRVTEPVAAGTRLAGLDGLRAIAVALVVAYHFTPGLLPGGYVGVDIFFVLSGFLITTILVREHSREGRVSLRRFWVHRARRLIPALAAVVAVCVAAVSVAVAALQVRGAPVDGTPWGDLLVGVGGQLVAAATFTSNWHTVLEGQSYAAAGSAPLLANLWSLAVEEQFYLLWPLVVVGVLGAGIALRRAALGAAAAALVSAAAMALLLGGGDPTRVYVGTDTHAFGLMIGAALAFAWRARGAPIGGGRAGVATVVGAIGAVTLVAVAVTMHWDAAWTYRGGLLVAATATAAVIVAVLRRPALGAALDARPLRWIGERSYGIYLWHWPLLVLLATALDGGRIRAASPLTVALATVLTVAAAAASYRWLESPVRTLGFRRAAAALVDWLHPDPVDDAVDALRVARRRRAALFGGTVAAVIALTGSAVAAAPAQTSLELQLERGAQAVEVSGESSTAPIPPLTAPSASALGAEPADVAEAAPAVEMPTGREVVIIGDSVTVGSADALAELLPGLVIKAKVGKQFATGVDEVVDMVERDVLRPYLVLALGTNGAVRDEDLDRLLAVAGERPIVLVTPYGDRSWMPGAQRAIRNAANRHPTVVLADWQRAVEKDPSILGPDGIHPRPSGVRVFVRTVERALLAAAEVGATR